MNLFLRDKELICPKSLIHQNIKKEDILTGKCIFVQDETNQIIAYQNPRLAINLNCLVSHLCHDQDILQARREETLATPDNTKEIGKIDYFNHLIDTDRRPQKKRMKKLQAKRI